MAIEPSIFRNSGDILWESTIGDAIDVFKRAKAAKFHIVFCSAFKGAGKSTAFSHSVKLIEAIGIRSLYPGIYVDGDIVRVLIATLTLDRFDPEWTLHDIAKGIAIEGFNPYAVKINYLDRDTTIKLSYHLGDSWKKKIALTTHFKGCRSTHRVFIQPELSFLKKNLTRRQKAMLHEDSRFGKWNELAMTSLARERKKMFQERTLESRGPAKEFIVIDNECEKSLAAGIINFFDDLTTRNYANTAI